MIRFIPQAKRSSARPCFIQPGVTQPCVAQPGFTLLELVLVMVIIVIALSVVAPRLSGFSRGRALHDVADQFISTTRFARSQAVTNGTIYRLTISAQDGHSLYQLTRQDGTNFVAVPGEMGQAMQIPDGMHAQMKRTEQQAQSPANSAMNSGNNQASPQPTPQDSVDFFPSGRTQTAQIVFTAADGDSLMIECPSAAEDFAVTTKTN
jgi:type II secretion system protein H